VSYSWTKARAGSIRRFDSEFQLETTRGADMKTFAPSRLRIHVAIGWSVGVLLFLAMAVLGVLAIAVAPPIALSSERYSLEGKVVTIYNIAGEVTVESGSGPNVEVEVVRGGRDAGELKVQSGSRGDREVLRILYSDDTVIYPELGRGSSTTLRVDSDGTWGEGKHTGWMGGRRVTIRGSGRGLEAWADLRIRVPSGCDAIIRLGAGAEHAEGIVGDLVLDTSSGSVDCSDVRGTVKIDTGSGSVSVRDIEGDLDVDTGSGSVEAESVRSSRFKVDTGSGSVSVSRATAEEFNVETGSGSVSAARVTADEVHVDTGSGRVMVELMRDARSVAIDTGSGDVRVTVPDDFGATFEIDTGSGGIDVEVPHRLTRRESGYLRGSIGDADGTLKVDTGSGGVQILKSR
jgi:DUF4097 and DUF4098 domain-containing protein YvlB